MNIIINSISASNLTNYCDSAWIANFPGLQYGFSRMQENKKLFSEWVEYISETNNFRQVFTDRLANGLPGYDQAFNKSILFSSVVILACGHTYAIFKDLDGEEMFYMKVDIHEPGLNVDEDYSIIKIDHRGTGGMKEIRTHFHHIHNCDPVKWCYMGQSSDKIDTFKRIVEGYNAICKLPYVVVGVVQYN
ncbi:MAG: hypothetical protein NC489_08660 [Ruminococcus flavefaciens]|nr:hypothetical protein [Ruminococcus flavefaciens]